MKYIRRWFWDSRLGMISTRGIFAATFIGLFVCGLGITQLAKIQCAAKAEKMGVEHDYGFFSTCQVNIDGSFVPLKNYRVIGEDE